MKSFFALTLSISFLILAGIVRAESEEVCGTWINTEYKFREHYQFVNGFDQV